METLLNGRLSQYFRIIPVVSDEQKELVYRLRYQIYCEERQYEDATSRPDGMECDSFDKHSAHSLLVHRETGNIAGTARLVLANQAGLEVILPMEQCWKPTDEWTRTEILKTPRHALAEVSRFAISRTFRRRFAERYVWGSENLGNCTHETMRQTERRLAPHLMLALVAALIRMSHDNNVTHWHAMMEPALVRRLGCFGMVFDRVDAVVDFHGQRHPCFTDLRLYLQRMKEYSLASGQNTWDQVVGDYCLWDAHPNDAYPNLNYLQEDLRKAA